MFKVIAVTVLLCLACSVSAFAGVVNGDFESGTADNWTQWKAPWVDDGAMVYGATEGSAYDGNYGLNMQINGFASWGLYQEVAVVPGVQYRLEGMWMGVMTSGGWIEAMLIDGPWNYDQADLPEAGCRDNIVAGYDGGAGWPAPDNWAWQPFSTTYSNWLLADGSRVASGNVMTVVLKIGGTNTNVYFDNVDLVPVPEPSSLLALAGGVGLLGGLIRRRR